MSPFPPALFEAKYTFRKADKPQLAKAIDAYAQGLSAAEDEPHDVPKTENYILDGGSLIHRVHWMKGTTYGSIANGYADFVVRNYGRATVVFDGYSDEPSIKDSTHQRRQKKHHPKVNFTEYTVFMGKKDKFLSNWTCLFCCCTTLVKVAIGTCTSDLTRRSRTRAKCIT